MTKEEAFNKIREHIEVLVQYKLIDERVGSTLIGFIYDYIDEVNTVSPLTIDIKYLEQFWKMGGNHKQEPPSDEPFNDEPPFPPSKD